MDSFGFLRTVPWHRSKQIRLHMRWKGWDDACATVVGGEGTYQKKNRKTEPEMVTTTNLLMCCFVILLWLFFWFPSGLRLLPMITSVSKYRVNRIHSTQFLNLGTNGLLEYDLHKCISGWKTNHLANINTSILRNFINLVMILYVYANCQSKFNEHIVFTCSTSKTRIELIRNGMVS